MQAAGAPHRAEHATTLGFLKRWSQLHAKRRPDLVVVDPPRAGLGEAVAHAMAPLHAAEIVYVSCDPTTLVRDARALLNSGYAVEELHLLNLFPQTFHMETIAVFRKQRL